MDIIAGIDTYRNPYTKQLLSDVQWLKLKGGKKKEGKLIVLQEVL